MLQASPLCEVCNWGDFGGDGSGSVEVETMADKTEVVRR